MRRISIALAGIAAATAIGGFSGLEYIHTITPKIVTPVDTGGHRRKRSKARQKEAKRKAYRRRK